MIFAPPRRDRRRPISTATLGTLLVIASTLGGAIVSGYSAFGGKGMTPRQRFEALEQAQASRDSLTIVAIDSLNRTHMALIGRNGSRVDTLTELTQRMAAQQCLSDDPVVRRAVRESQMPCARILHDLGINR